MAATRNQIVKTPGKLIFDPGGTPVAVYSATGISVELQETLVALPSTRWGEHDQVMTGRLVKIECQPTHFNAAGLAKLFTHAAVPMGGSIVGSTDKPLEIHTRDGKKRRLACHFIFQEPALSCAAGKTILGNVVIYGICGLNGDSGDLDDLYDEDTVTWSDADWPNEDEIAPGWNASWTGGSASAWDDIWTKEAGFVITPRSQLTEDTSTRDGLVNVTINGYGLDIAATVLNISESLVLDAMGRTLKPGQRKSSLGRDLKLNATDGSAFIRCYNAVLQPGYQFGFNATDSAVASLSWKTFPLVTAGVRGPHLLVSTTDPDA